MKFSAKNILVVVYITSFFAACSGGREKQAVVVQPAPSSKGPASESGKTPAPGQQQGSGQEQGQGQGQGPEHSNGGSQPLGGVQPKPENSPPFGPLTEGQGQGGGTTDLSIEAIFDDSTPGGSQPLADTQGITSVESWDGRSFKGSGKWTVDPVD